MKLKNEQEVENLSDSMQRKLDITRKVWTFKDGFKSGYIQAQQDLLASASKGFEDFCESNTSRYFGLGTFQRELDEQLWQACSLSHAKKMQEKDAEITKRDEEIRKLEDEYERRIGQIDRLEEAKEVWKARYKDFRYRIMGY